jgi:glycosidase
MKTQWWKNAVGYQINPRSFFDSNGDGIGDLRGIIEKLDYIENLGVDCVWICPFYRSPMDDNGYDVSDFYDVDPIFGNMDDAQELIHKAHSRGIHIILDLVLNHTSDEHPWFVEARSSIDNPKRDWYIWQKPRHDEKGKRIPPTNWASFFEGSCWNYDEISQEYYLKIFSDKMPDLNWANPELRKEMYRMARWWLDLGVDGFRVDAVAHLAKDSTFEDSTMKLNRDGVAPDWSKFSNRAELFPYLHEFHDAVLKHYDCVSIGEVGGGAGITDAIEYAGYHSKAFNMVFNFDHCWKNGAFGSEDKQDDELIVDVVDLKKTMDRWIQGMKGKGWIPHYWLNHDHPRVISQYGNTALYHRASGCMLGTVLLTLPGTPFIYNGEEIGMTNVDYTDIEDFNDVWVKNYYAKAIKRQTSEQILTHLRRTSRDNARTPMQWNDTKNAGFSKGIPHQKPVGNYRLINVEAQSADPSSILNAYKHLIKLRKHGHLHHCLVHGDFELISSEIKDLFIFERSTNEVTVLVVANFRNHEVAYTLPYLPQAVHYDNYGIAMITKKLRLQPYQALVLEK